LSTMYQGGVVMTEGPMNLFRVLGRAIRFAWPVLLFVLGITIVLWWIL
jgi:hypothetical protein